MKSALPVLTALAFPLLAHGSVVLHSRTMAAAAVLLLGLLLLSPLRARAAGALGLVALLTLLVLAWSADRIALMLTIPPVLLTAAAGVWFARSLWPDRTPLIERIALAIESPGEEIQGLQPYARGWTWVWAAALLLLSAINLALALLATPGGWLDAFGVSSALAVPLHWWSLFANGLNYLLIGALFVAEYLHRRWYFRHRPQLSPREFALRLARLGPAFWRSESHR